MSADVSLKDEMNHRIDKGGEGKGRHCVEASAERGVIYGEKKGHVPK